MSVGVPVLHAESIHSAWTASAARKMNTVAGGGVNCCKDHVEVHLRYMMMWLCVEDGTRILVSLRL